MLLDIAHVPPKLNYLFERYFHEILTSALCRCPETAALSSAKIGAPEVSHLTTTFSGRWDSTEMVRGR